MKSPIIHVLFVCPFFLPTPTLVAAEAACRDTQPAIAAHQHVISPYLGVVAARQEGEAVEDYQELQEQFDAQWDVSDESAADRIEEFMNAATRGDIGELSDLLLVGKCSISLQDHGLRNALMYAASGGDADTCDYLIKQGIDPDARDRCGRTALMYAVAGNNANACRKLLNSGANYKMRTLLPKDKLGSKDLRGAVGWDVAMIAACYGHTEVMQMLLDKVPNVHEEDMKAYRHYFAVPLLLAARWGYEEVCSMIITHIKGGTHTYDFARVAALVALEGGHREVAHKLIQTHLLEDALLSKRVCSKKIPFLLLVWSIAGRHAQLSHDQLAHMHEVARDSVADEDAALVLHALAAYANAQIWEKISQSKHFQSLVPSIPKNIEMMLQTASHKKNADMVAAVLVWEYQMLYNSKIPISFHPFVETYLHHIIRYGNEKAWKSICTDQHLYAHVTRARTKLLLDAIKQRNFAAYKTLINLKANVNAADQGGTALSYAVAQAQPKAKDYDAAKALVADLIARGARNGLNEAWRAAQRNQAHEICDLLRAIGGRCEHVC